MHVRLWSSGSRVSCPGCIVLVVCNGINKMLDHFHKINRRIRFPIFNAVLSLCWGILGIAAAPVMWRSLYPFRVCGVSREQGNTYGFADLMGFANAHPSKSGINYAT